MRNHVFDGRFGVGIIKIHLNLSITVSAVQGLEAPHFVAPVLGSRPSSGGDYIHNRGNGCGSNSYLWGPEESAAEYCCCWA